MAETNGSKFGSSSTVVKLWEGRSNNDRLIWLTEPPEPEPEANSSSESPEHAITLLHREIGRTGKYTLETIIMRSPALYRFLDETVPNLSSFYHEAEHGIVMRAPFRLLYWQLDPIRAAAKGDDKELSEAVALLQGVLEEYFHNILEKRKELLARQEMNFETLWTLYKPGTTCLTIHEGNIVAVKISSLETKTDPSGMSLYRIGYSMLGWDGEYMGWLDAFADILQYSGRRKIVTLEIFPVEFYQNSNIVAQLIARGKRFAEIAIKEPHMMSFNGETLDRPSTAMWWHGEQKQKMFERVVLDARAYNHYYKKFSVSRWKKPEELQKLLEAGEDETAIFLYCCTEFHCFALQQKKWSRVWIDSLSEVVFNDTAYPSLVLPNDYKELLLAFAEAQVDGDGFDDVIAGKGQGILMLLAGPPGTGKTLTAESIAEHMKRPLYSVSAGELGASVRGMEHELDRVLELATRWNAVLLLDEADVFLEKRTDHDLKRNTVVSVFLKKLEYYRGVMLLTTNRIGSFDEAFKSRIHVAIRYPDLDHNARRSIWEGFLKKAREIYQPGVKVTTEELDQISKKQLNGREIRNIVKSAQLLASRAKQPLNKTHLDTVWRVEHQDSPWTD